MTAPDEAADAGQLMRAAAQLDADAASALDLGDDRRVLALSKYADTVRALADRLPELLKAETECDRLRAALADVMRLTPAELARVRVVLGKALSVTEWRADT